MHGLKPSSSVAAIEVFRSTLDIRNVEAPQSIIGMCFLVDTGLDGFPRFNQEGLRVSPFSGHVHDVDGGAYGIAGAGLGTSPELIGPSVNRLGAGPELNCTGAICSVSSSNVT
ncbi:hypothetical protein Tco_1532092 [Tanacetum coccineum]